MMSDVKIKQFTHHGLNLLNTRVAEFKHPFTIGTNQVIVLLV
jgi:hypothetical protein